MDKLHAQEAASASVRKSMLEQDLMMLEYRGVVTMKDWLGFGRSGVWPGPSDVIGVLLRCDTGLVLMTPKDAVATADAAAPMLDPKVIGAVVVLPEQVEVFRAFAWRLASFGITRSIFTDLPSALAWLREVATVERQHRHWVRSRMLQRLGQ